MARQGALAALILVLGACTPGTSSSKGGAGADASGTLEVGVEIENAAGAALREGDLATIVFRIRNAGKTAILLRDLTQPRDLMLAGSSGAVMTWQYSQPGLVTYSAEKDEWTYEKGRRSDGPRPVFNSGLLVGGESLAVRARVRVLEMPMDFQFSFFDLTLDDLRRKVYFEVREPKVLRYRTMVGRDLEDQLVKSTRSEEGGHRIVVFPHAEPVATNALLKTVRLQETLKPRFFNLDQAARKAGIARPRAGDYTFSIVFDAWILPLDQGHVMVTPAAITPLPELRHMERIFHFIDSIVPEKITVELRAHSAATALGELKYRVVKDEKEVPVTKDVKEKRTYYYLYLTAEQVPRFLADLRSLKLALDIEYKEGGGMLLVHNK